MLVDVVNKEVLEQHEVENPVEFARSLIQQYCKDESPQTLDFYDAEGEHLQAWACDADIIAVVYRFEESPV